MRKSIKYIVIAIIAFSTLSLGSCATQNRVNKGAKQEKCVKQKREKKQKLEFVSLDKIKGNFKDGITLVVTVDNNTCFNLRLLSAEAHVLHKGRKFARVSVENEVKIPRRSRSQVEVTLRATVANNLSTLSALNNILKGTFSGWTIDLNFLVATGISKHHFEEKGISLENLIKQLDLPKLFNTTNLSKLTNISLNDVKNIVNQIFK